jgi:hypothetical protein
MSFVFITVIQTSISKLEPSGLGRMTGGLSLAWCAESLCGRRVQLDKHHELFKLNLRVVSRVIFDLAN